MLSSLVYIGCISLLWTIPLSATLEKKADPSVVRTKVVILGGGGSGISAAVTLHNKNISDFIVVDAQSFIGGRVQHQDFGGKTVELGANWIYGKGTNPIYRLAQRHGLKTIPNDKNDVVYFDQHRGQIPTEEGKKASALFDATMGSMVEFASTRLKRNQVDLSSRTALQLLNWTPDTNLKAAVEYFGVNWELAEPAEMSSLDYATGTVDTVSGSFPQGNDFVVDSRGFNYILEQEATRLFKDNGSRLLLNTLVTEVIYDQDQVTVVTADGKTIVADHALCTFSLGVLQGQDVKFIPEFPDWKREALLSFHMTTYSKIFVKFDTKFWGDWEFALYGTNGTRYGGDYTVWQNLATTGFQQHSDQHNVLMVTTTFKESEKVEIKSDEQVKQEIHQALQHMFPDRVVPFPTDILIPRWRQHPLFRGSYSNWPIGMSLQHHENMRAPLPAPTHPTSSPRLWFAGEATSQKHFGYLHGAWLNGQEVASVIANCLLEPSCHHHFHYHPYVTGCGDLDTETRLQRTSRYPDSNHLSKSYQNNHSGKQQALHT